MLQICCSSLYRFPFLILGDVNNSCHFTCLFLSDGLLYCMNYIQLELPIRFPLEDLLLGTSASVVSSQPQLIDLSALRASKLQPI